MTLNRMPATPAPLVLALCAALLADTPRSQHRTDGDTPGRPTPARQAERMVKLLELPDRRRDAVQQLLQLGEAAVPALLRGVDHPRDEIALASLQMLGELGPLAHSAAPRLDSLARASDRTRAHAAKWARARLQHDGSTLVVDYTTGCVLQFDKTGKEVFRLKNQNGSFDGERLADGNFLVSRYLHHEVREVDPRGKVLWRFTKAKFPADADRLANGNTLISDSGGRRVIEVDRAGKIVWQHACACPYDADRLPSGNTLITDFLAGRVFEVTPRGNVAWEVLVSQAFGADRLRNGNTLIPRFGPGEVIEVDPNGKTVAKITGLQVPNEARRLPNGHTLVAAGDGVREFDATGKQVGQRIRTYRAATVHRY